MYIVFYDMITLDPEYAKQLDRLLELSYAAVPPISALSKYM
jgi:hypothetical protein